MLSQMSVQEPVAVVKSMFSRFASGGAAAAAALLHDDVVWVPHDRPEREFRSRDAFLARFRKLAAEGTRIEAVGHVFEDHGDCVVVVGRIRVLSAQGHYDIPMCWQVDVAEGLVTRVTAERHVEDAREECAPGDASRAA